MMRRQALVICLTLLLGSSCSVNAPVAGGGGTVTTNGIAVSGIATDTQRRPIAGALVQARTEWFRADTAGGCVGATCIDTRTDRYGHFELRLRDSTAHTILIAGTGLAAAARIASPSETSRLLSDTIVLEPQASIEGSVVVPGDSGRLSGAVWVAGMERISTMDAGNRFRLEALPAGQLCLQARVGQMSPVNFFFTAQAGKTLSLPEALPLADIASGQAAYWPCDDPADEARLTDASGNGRDGSVAGATRIPGRIGQALYFFQSSHRATVTAPILLPRMGTIAFWFFADTTIESQTLRMVSSSSSAFEVTIRGNRIVHEIGAVNLQYLSDTTIISAGRWYHVACTWESGSQATAIYLDGSLRAQGSTARALPADAILTFGSSMLHSGSFAGKLDDIRLYERVLEPGQIRVLAAGGF